MDPNVHPLMGVNNPQMADWPLYRGQVAKRKIVSHAARITRESLVVNFRMAVKVAYPDLAPNTAYLKIAKAVGCSLSTLQRIASGQVSPQTDTLADIAWHLGTTVDTLVSTRRRQAVISSQPTRRDTLT